MFTKTQIRIMEVFVSRINNKFSIKEISELLKKPYALIYNSVQDLIEKSYLLKDEKNLIFLNYRDNFSELAYIESERKKEFLNKDKILYLFAKDVIEKCKLDSFIFLIFGSSVEHHESGTGKGPRDIDILFIIDDKSKTDEIEKFLYNLASNFTKKFDINVISYESANEMLLKRENINIMNESLNKHIIIFGAENYYRLLKNAR